MHNTNKAMTTWQRMLCDFSPRELQMVIDYCNAAQAAKAAGQQHVSLTGLSYADKLKLEALLRAVEEDRTE